MNGIVSLLVVAVICGFWVFLFGRAFYKSIAGRKQNDDRHSGRFVNGRIISSDIKGTGSITRVNMVVEFPNFSNSDVKESFVFKDSKPQENRYEEGKTVQLILDEDPKKGPSVRLAGGVKKGSNAFSLIAFLLFGGSIYGVYQLYNLLDSKVGGDWSNVGNLDVFEGFSIMGVSFIVSLLFVQFIFRKVNLTKSSKGKNKEQELKLYGVKTMGKILKVEETGTKINDNPMIRFHYEYKDDFGNMHKGKDQMVLGMLELANINDIEEREIIYSKDFPAESRMMDAMKGPMMAGCSKLITLFIAMIFTIVIMSMFLGSLLA